MFVFLFFDEIISMPSSTFDTYFAFSSSMSGIDATRNWWENSCIFHGAGDTIGWESDRKKHPYFGESMGINFPGSLKLMGNLSISHVMKYITWWESGWRNAPMLWEKYELPISQAFLWVLLHFPVLWEIDGKTHAFPM